jgi:hypothetical protein
MFDSTYVMQRNASARGVRIAQEKEKARKAEIAKATEKQKAGDVKNTESASAGSSWRSKKNVTQQPSGEVQTQLTSELHSVGVSTAPATSTAILRWVHFRSAGCCACAQDADGHH